MRVLFAGMLFIALFAPCRGQTPDTLQNDFLRNRSVALFTYVLQFIPQYGDQWPYGTGAAIRLGNRNELRLSLTLGGQDFQERQRATGIAAGYFRYANISEKNAFVYGAEFSAYFTSPPKLSLMKIPGSLTLAHSRWSTELSAGITYSPFSLLQLAGEYRLGYWYGRGWTDNDLEYEVISNVRLSFQFRIW
jgi:hypothetical protein